MSTDGDLSSRIMFQERLVVCQWVLSEFLESVWSPLPFDDPMILIWEGDYNDFTVNLPSRGVPQSTTSENHLYNI